MLVTRQDFEKNTGSKGITARFPQDATKFVKLCQIAEIEEIVRMPVCYLHAILYNIEYGQPVRFGKAYSGCRYQLTCVDPAELHVTQTFVQKDKLNFFETFFTERFQRHNPAVIEPITDCGPFIVIGKTADGSRVLANYLPPIIEVHDSKKVLLEGLHRNYTAWCKQSRQLAILIHGVQAPLPWETRPWHQLQEVEVKPPPEARKFGIQRHEYFRHFADVGINT